MSKERISLGICTGVESASHLARAGVDFIEVNVQGFLKPEAGDAEFAPNRDAAAASPLPLRAANCFLPGDLKTTGPDVDTARLARYFETAFARASAAGADFVVFGSGGSRAVPDGWPRDKAVSQVVEALSSMGPAAEKHGVTLVMEALNSNECNFVNSLAEAAELVEKVGHPNVRLLADIYHMLRDGERPAEIERFGAMLSHVHIAEVEKRTRPGLAGDDFRPYLAALKAVGYSGGISMECRWDDLESEAPKAVEYLRGQMLDAGL